MFDLLVFMVPSLIPWLFPRFLLCRLLLLPGLLLGLLFGLLGSGGGSGFRDSDGRQIVPFFSKNSNNLTNWDFLRASLHL